MRPIHGTLFARKDLSSAFSEATFEEINANMFGIVINKIIFSDDILIFVDDDGRSKIIKNRFGKDENP